MPVQRLPAGRLVEELAKVEDRRDPPVPVWAWLLLDGAEWPGLLHGWSSNPRGSGDGWRGLVVVEREFAPGLGVGSSSPLIARSPGSRRFRSPGEGVFASVVLGVGSKLRDQSRSPNPVVPPRGPASECSGVGTSRPGDDEHAEPSVRGTDVGRA